MLLMSGRATLSAVVEDVLSELESELERDSFEAQDAGGFSCSGWEGDLESFSKRAAQFFCNDAFNLPVGLPSSIKCSGKICIVRFMGPGGVLPLFDRDIRVDLSTVPGVVTVSGQSGFLGLKPTTCSYSYACDASSINFTRIRCKTS
jgi:hypothetical protein